MYKHGHLSRSDMKNKSETSMTASVLKQDPHTFKKKKKKVNKTTIYYDKTQHANFRDRLLLTGHQNNRAKQLNPKQMSVLHLIFHCLTVV